MSDTTYEDIIAEYYSTDLVPYLSTSHRYINKIKLNTKLYSTKVVEFFQRPETKIASLISYWAVEAVISAMAIYAFMTLSMYGSAFAMLIMLAYLSYATFGVVGEATKS